MNKQTLYLECTSGISGDMAVAALLDLGADRHVLTEALDSLPLEGYRIEIKKICKSGVRSCDFSVILEHDNHDHDMQYLYDFRNTSEAHDGHGHEASTTHGQQHDAHAAPDTHGQQHDAHAAPDACNPRETHEGHAHHHHHTDARNLKDITAIISRSGMTSGAKALALRIFDILAQAEAYVHQKPVDEVHFHEVGAVDSIVDIAAVAVCLDNLGFDHAIIGGLTEGCGQIRCQHGILPVPVPAVNAILTKFQLPVTFSGIQGELITPTGAAIAAALADSFRMPERFRILRTGYGAGKRKYQASGLLRAMLLEYEAMDPPEERAENTSADTVCVLETNIDDCSGEAMSFVMDELLKAGALDVCWTPIYMKKNRPAYQLTVICPPLLQTTMERLIFLHTTSIGIRHRLCGRTRLDRKIIALETPWGMADVKCCTYGQECYFYPENDSVVALARQHGMSFQAMYRSIQQYAEETGTGEK